MIDKKNIVKKVSKLKPKKRGVILRLTTGTDSTVFTGWKIKNRTGFKVKFEMQKY